MQAKTTVMVKDELPNPSWRPIAIVTVDTVAKCDQGIPPESSIILESHLFSLYLSI